MEQGLKILRNNYFKIDIFLLTWFKWKDCNDARVSIATTTDATFREMKYYVAPSSFYWNHLLCCQNLKKKKNYTRRIYKIHFMSFLFISHFKIKYQNLWNLLFQGSDVLVAFYFWLCSSSSCKVFLSGCFCCFFLNGMRVFSYYPSITVISICYKQLNSRTLV